MKTHYITIMVAALLLTACGHRASNGSTTDVLKTDSIGMQREDTAVMVSVSAEWPIAGNTALVENIQRYISEEMATNIGDEKPKAIISADGHKVVEATFNRYQQALTTMRNEAQQAGYADGMQYSYYLHLSMMEANSRYVTYLCRAEGFTGGAHGFATSTAQSFSATTGQRIGYEANYNFEKEVQEIKNQTLFKEPLSPQLYALIKEGVRSYFQEFDESVASDEQLKDMLIGVNDVNRIPLPSAAPAFTKKGLAFIYQQYEIAPYAAGMVNFDIAYDKIRPFLTAEAQALLP